MKFLLTLILSIAFLQTMIAQPKSTDEALAQEEEELPVLMVFSGSDWCKPCIKMKKEVLDSPQFQAFAKDRLSIQIVDFPYKKANKLPKEQQAMNESLAEQFNPGGIMPTVILFDETGRPMRQIKKRSLEPFMQEIEKLLGS